MKAKLTPLKEETDYHWATEEIEEEDSDGQPAPALLAMVPLRKVVEHPTHLSEQQDLMEGTGHRPKQPDQRQRHGYVRKRGNLSDDEYQEWKTLHKKLGKDKDSADSSSRANNRMYSGRWSPLIS